MDRFDQERIGVGIRNGGIAQLVDRRTEQPCAILTRVRVPGVAKGVFSQSRRSMQTLLRCPYGPVFNLACINICAHVQNLKQWQPYHCFDTQNIKFLF